MLQNAHADIVVSAPAAALKITTNRKLPYAIPYLHKAVCFEHLECFDRQRSRSSIHLVTDFRD
jgi:hypothetical protein